jgi:hypothetical protein
MGERRYDEDEVAEIFRRATQEVQRSLVRGEPALAARSEGLTLEELQAIGAEVGIDRAMVARSAATLASDAEGGHVTHRVAGVPLGVARSTVLPRRLTEDEWEQVVVDLRQTFDARGRVARQGKLREWTNGNLQAFLEPTPDGERFRIRTRKSGGEVPVMGGMVMVVFALLVSLITLGTGDPLSEVIREGGILTLLGGLGFGFGSMSLRRWSAERQSQMAAVSERVALMAAGHGTDGPRRPPGS